MEYMHIDLPMIHPSPTNPRKTFPAEEMAEMIDSVRRHGVIQPILVRPWPETYAHVAERAPVYELVAGERRYRAAKGAELETIPVMVRNLTDHEVLEIQIIENLQRKGLHPIEEAESYELMIKEHGYSADQLAEKIGKSRAYIYGRMKLTALCMRARLAFRDGKLTASTALLIARIPGEALQVKALDDITTGWEGILSYRAAAELIQDEYCLYLNEASFPQENLLLVSSAGACSTCPKRSGTNPELFADIERADVCTDPECYQKKSKAWLAYQCAQAEQEGKTVIHGEAAKKINIAISHDQYIPLDRRNYELAGAPTYREAIANTEVEIVLIEDQRSGKLVEAVERKALASTLVAAGIKPERDYRQEERELERRVRAENEYRRRLFDAWHTEMKAQLATDEKPDFELEELRLVAATLWRSLYSEGQEVVMGYWAKPSQEKEAWSKRSAMVLETADRIKTMDRRELILLLVDCALASDGRASSNSINHAPANLIERASACGIDAERIRNDIDAEKAAKATKSTAKKTTSTPTKAPLGAEVEGAKKAAIRPYEIEPGDEVQVKPDKGLVSGGKRGVVVGLNQEGMMVVHLDGELAAYVCNADDLDCIPVDTPTPTQAAPASDEKGEVETDEKPTISDRMRAALKIVYAHPENATLCWTGRGRKPKWVENWLAKDGATLDQLRVASDEEDQSSAPDGANAKPAMAEAVTRCTKTLELPLA